MILILITNIKQDPLKIVTERMHKFQIDFLNNYFEKKDKINLNYWNREIDIRREEVKAYLKKGIRKISKSKETEIDSYIVDSWNEVVSVIKSKIQKAPEINLDKIEVLLRRVIEEGKSSTSERQISVVNQIDGIDEVKKIDNEVENKNNLIAGEIEELEELEDDNSSEVAGSAGLAQETMEIDEIQELEEIHENVVDEKSINEVQSNDRVENQIIVDTNVGINLSNQVNMGQEKQKQVNDIEYLAIVPEIEELPLLPAEKLEELESVDFSQNGEAFESDSFKSFENQIVSKNIKIISINLVLEKIKEDSNSIIFNNGIYKISENAYKKEPSTKKIKGLKALAQSLLNENRNGIYSIDELYKNQSIMDESQQIRINEKALIKKKIEIKKPELLFCDRGFNIDQYVEAISFQITDKVIIYAIGELIKKIKAVSAVLFVEDNGLKPSIAIGLTNRSINSFIISGSEQLFQKYLKEKNIIVIHNIFQQVTLFSKKISKDDLKFINSAIFIPAIIYNKDSYLFFGLSDDKAIGDINRLLLVLSR
jgi:hypothetical protein